MADDALLASYQNVWKPDLCGEEGPIVSVTALFRYFVEMDFTHNKTAL